MGERRPWRELSSDLFRFTTTELRDLHLAVMTAIDDASVLAPSMNLDHVRAAVDAQGWDQPLDDEGLQRALAQLTEWKLLEATQDHAAHYASPEEFERRNLQWSLTPRGEAAVSGVLHALDRLRHAVGLQPAVLDAIGDGLADLVDLLASPGTEPRIATRLAEVEGHLTSLITSVRQFHGQLQRLLRDDGAEDSVFLEVKRRTVTYLEEYIEGVERPQRRVADGIARIDAIGGPNLLDRALVGANLAPVAGADPGPTWLAERHRRWRALEAWFVTTDSMPPRIDGLIDVARTAVLELLRALERRWDSRRRSASIAHDYRQLARWFAATPTADDAHRLFLAAFGMWPSRHAHLAALDAEDVPTTTSWLVAPAVEVAPSLRTTGTTSQRGQVPAVADPAALRARRQREQAEALAAHHAVRDALLTDGAVRLSSFDGLPTEPFAELLALLATALEAPIARDGARRATSIDGQVEVVVRDRRDGATAEVTTTSGVLRGPDFDVSIRVACSSLDTPSEAAGA